MRLAAWPSQRGESGQLCPCRQGITGGGDYLFTEGMVQRIDVVDFEWDGMLKEWSRGRSCHCGSPYVQRDDMSVGGYAPGAGDSSV